MKAVGMPLNTAIEIDTDICLLIFNPHESTVWIDRVFHREAERCSHILLGGDYFDPRGDETAGAPSMARRLLEMRELYGERMTVLLGNHDIPYLWALPWVRRRQIPPRLNAPPFLPTDFSRSRAKRIGKILGEDFWRDCRLFQKVNGWLISHPGILPAQLARRPNTRSRTRSPRRACARRPRQPPTPCPSPSPAGCRPRWGCSRWRVNLGRLVCGVRGRAPLPADRWPLFLPSRRATKRPILMSGWWQNLLRHSLARW